MEQLVLEQPDEAWVRALLGESAVQQWSDDGHAVDGRAELARGRFVPTQATRDVPAVSAGELGGAPPLSAGRQ
ncbi:hypothetical protein OG930_24345 [Streptomyces sp. NBC_01799]|nr:hypothetical protein OG930_24345 [Streptomyces sp. NBC_01799]